LILRLIETLADDPAAVPSIEQDHTAFRLFHRAPPDDGMFDWKRPAAQVSAFIRAFDYHPLPSPWGHPMTVLNGRHVGVLGALRTHRRTNSPPGTIEAAPDRSVYVACSDEWLRIRRMVIDGRVVLAGTSVDSRSAEGAPA
jgi:methionyl-tRNA formyltransferase